MFIIPKIAHY